VVALDPADADGIWITEVWDMEESHEASLSLPSVQDAIAKGMPLIAEMDEGMVTEPVGGHGLMLLGRARSRSGRPPIGGATAG
jgi:quinol monooxygenase YgiN